MDYFLEHPDLTVALIAAMALVVGGASIAHLRFYIRKRRMDRLRAQALPLGLIKTILDTLEHVERAEAILPGEVDAFETACGQLRMVGDEREKDLAGKSLANVLTYVAARDEPPEKGSPEEQKIRKTLVETGAANASDLARLLLDAANRRIAAARA